MALCRSEQLREALDRHGAVGTVERLISRVPRVSWDELANTRIRRPHVVARRHEVWSVVHGSCGLTIGEMGRAFSVDHTSVLAALRKRERGLGQ